MVLDRTPQSLQSVKLDDSGDGANAPFSKTLKRGKDGQEDQGETFGLPEPWERRRDPDGNIFYFNRKSKLSQWHPPPGLYEVRLLEHTTASYTIGLVRAPKTVEAPAASSEPDASALSRPGRYQRPKIDQGSTSSLKSLVGYAYHSLFARKDGKDHRQALMATHNAKKAAARKRRIAAAEKAPIELEEEEPTLWGYVKVVVSEGFGIETNARKATCRITLRKSDRTKVDSFDQVVDLKKDAWNVKADFACYDPLSTVVISLAATANSVMTPIGKVELQVRDTLDQWRDVTSTDGSEAGMILVLLTHELAEQATRVVIDEALPAGWESKVTPDGRVFYVDEFHKSTQWSHPASTLPDPKDWIKRKDAEGRVEYVEIQPKKQFVKDWKPKVRYTNPNEPEDVKRARENTVGVLNGLTDLMEAAEDSLGDRAAIQDRTDWQYAKTQQVEHRESVDWESFEGRLASFNREAHGCQYTVWPHGKHKLRDRPAMYDMLVGFVLQSGKPAPKTLQPGIALHTDIPVVEGHFFKRKGNAPSLYWEQFYCELRVDVENRYKVHFVWGELDPWEVHQTGRVIQSRGAVSKEAMSKAWFCARDSADVSAIHRQFVNRDQTNMFGFDVRMQDGSVHNFASESLDACKEVVAVLSGMPLDSEKAPHALHSPDAMARAGLFFAPSAQAADRVECGLCGAQFSNWGTDDKPLQRHKARSPQCAFFAEGYQDQPPKMLLADLHRPEALVHTVLIREETQDAGGGQDVRDVASGKGSKAAMAAGDTGGDLIARAPSVIQLFETGFFNEQVRKTALKSALSYEEAQAAGEQLRKQRHRLQKLSYGGEHGKELLDLCVANDIRGVKRLLAMDVPVNVTDGGLRTPLHWAAAMGNDQIASLLISHGADVEARTANGYTALMLARNAGFEAVIGHLHLAGAEDPA